MGHQVERPWDDITRGLGRKVRRLSPRKLASNRHRLHPRKFHSFARPHRAQRDRVERSKRASFGPNSADFPAFPFSNWVPAQTRGPNGEGARAAQTWVCSPSPDTSPPPSGLPRSGVRYRSTLRSQGAAAIVSSTVQQSQRCSSMLHSARFVLCGVSKTLLYPRASKARLSASCGS